MELEESSIDGSLQAFLEKQNISLEVESSGKVLIGDEKITDNDRQTFHVTAFLSTKAKINEHLLTVGITTVDLTQEEIELESSPWNGINQWADSLLSAIVDILQRSKSLEAAIQNTSTLGSQRGSVTTDALESRINYLQTKLFDSDKVIRSLEQQKVLFDLEREQHIKKIRELEHDSKRALRNFENQFQESERRVRQREMEIERLRAKLQKQVSHEKALGLKHKQALAMLEAGDLSMGMGMGDSKSPSRSPLSTAPSSSTPKRGSPSSHPHSHSPSHPHMSSGSRGSKQAEASPGAGEVIEALVAQRLGLDEENKELREQLLRMSKALRDHQNSASPAHPHTHPQSNSHMSPSSTSSASVDFSPPNRRRMSGARGGVSLRTAFNDGDDPNGLGEGGGEGEDSDAPEGASARALYEKVVAQRRRIAQLEHRLEVQRRTHEEAEDALGAARRRAAELREEIENLRLELGNRPTVKQWAQKQRELQDLEDKMHDLVMMRGEAAEIASWRKHLSTSDRIKADKRNYELGLWLLESLPKAVMKEVLQAACRELDVSEVSELQPAIAKLKLVVKAVPRLEDFIGAVCAYVLDRDVASGDRDCDGAPRRGMEDVFPVLKRWWKAVQRCEQLEGFADKLFSEIHRREHMLSQAQVGDDGYTEPAATGGPSPPGGPRNISEWEKRAHTHSGVGRGAGAGGGAGGLDWGSRDLLRAVDVVRDMSDFQIDVLRSHKSFAAGERFVQERPEQLLSRLVAHIQYLFEVTSLDGLLPRMNQVYVFTEEVRNFLSAMRELVGLPRGASDALLFAEIQKCVLGRGGSGR